MAPESAVERTETTRPSCGLARAKLGNQATALHDRQW